MEPPSFAGRLSDVLSWTLRRPDLPVEITSAVLAPKDGMAERVLFDGSGVVVRLWLSPVQGALALADEGTGAPIVEAPAEAFFSGAVAGYPAPLVARCCRRASCWSAWA